MEVKSRKVTVRFTQEEFRELQQKCKEAKINQTTFIRNATLGKEIYVIDGIKEFTTQLNRIGNNLNQLTVLAHKRAISEVNLEKTFDEFNRIWAELNKLRKNLREKKR